MGGFVGIRLEDFSQGGGIENGDYLLSNGKYHVWDYNGKGKPTLAFNLTATPVNVQTGAVVGEAKDQNWSIGDPAFFGPSEDGMKIVKLGTRENIAGGSNFFLFIKNLVEAGGAQHIPADGSANFLNGAIVRFQNMPQPKRENLPKNNVIEGGEERDRTIPVINFIHRAPTGQASVPVAAAAAAGVGAAAPAAVASAPAATTTGDVADVLAVKLIDALAGLPAAGKQRTAVRVGVYSAFIKDKEVPPATRDAAMKVFADDTQLANILGTIGFVLAGDLIKPGIQS
jgi:hypothetical protein